MAATPQSRRGRSSMTESGTSPPNAKRAARREVAPPSAAQADVTHIQLVQEVHNLHNQGKQDAKFFEQTNETIEQHADFLEAIRVHCKRMNQNIEQLTSDLARVAKEVVDNDAEVKSKVEDN